MHSFCLQGSHAAQDIRDSMSSVQQQLSGLQQQASALQQSLAAVAVAADQNLHASKLVPLSTGSPQSKPVKGMSKSKKAALILDAMKPLLSTALEQVRGCLYIWVLTSIIALLFVSL